MSDQAQLTELLSIITNEIQEQLNWRYEERSQSLLTEFAQNRGQGIWADLKKQFDHEWDHKSIKLAPPELASSLGALAKLKPNQKLLTRPTTEQLPAMVAIWWPWGHGGTYSLRLKTLSDTYDIANKQQPFIARLKKMFS